MSTKKLEIIVAEEQFEAGFDTITVRGLDWGRSVKYLSEIDKHTAVLFSAVNGQKLDSFGISKIMAEAPEIVNALIRFATGKDQDWIDSLPLESIIVLAVTAFRLSFSSKLADEAKKIKGAAMDATRRPTS